MNDRVYTSAPAVSPGFSGVNDRVYTSAPAVPPGFSGVNDRVYTSAPGQFFLPYFLCTSSYTSVIAFEGAAVKLLTIKLTARLNRKAGSSS